MVIPTQVVQNTFSNGFRNGSNGETSQSRFLFTSESVGEGHPGKYY